MTAHEQLLEDYARDLRTAKNRAEAWWRAMTDVESRRPPDWPSVHEAWPDGPASHPWVLAVIRRYWLACEALNKANLADDTPDDEESEPEYVLTDDDDVDEEDVEEDEEDDEVYPHVFVLEWLMTEEHDDLATFLGDLSYWPVGLDDNDDYT